MAPVRHHRTHLVAIGVATLNHTIVSRRARGEFSRTVEMSCDVACDTGGTAWMPP
jgi:hypothetical protein